jgi:hypothetical protein
MLQETLEPAWIQAFESVLRRCALQPGDTVAVLCEPASASGARTAGRGPDRLHCLHVACL